jgi:endonuclease YncB( thermonuclease family)
MLKAFTNPNQKRILRNSTINSLRTHSRLAALALLLVVNPLSAQTISGRVVRVADGDTITVLAADNRQVRVRLAWIDAPERGQAFGNVSRKSLAGLVVGKTVRVEEHDRDRYGRTVGTVFVDGSDVNLEQIRRGFAWVYDRTLSKLPAMSKFDTRKRKRKLEGSKEDFGKTKILYRLGNFANCFGRIKVLGNERRYKGGVCCRSFLRFPSLLSFWFCRPSELRLRSPLATRPLSGPCSPASGADQSLRAP